MKLHIGIRKGRKLQTDLTTELCNQFSYYNQEGFTLDDIKNLEKLINIQINVVCAENFNSVIYKGPEKNIKIYLCENGNHFDVISKMAGFLGSTYYCHQCNKPYEHKDKHKCQRNCEKLPIMFSGRTSNQYKKENFLQRL